MSTTYGNQATLSPSSPVSQQTPQPHPAARQSAASTKEKNQLVLNSMVMSHKSKKRKTKAGNNVYVLNPEIAKAAQDYIKSGNIDSDVAKYEEEEEEEEDTTGFESDDECKSIPLFCFSFNIVVFFWLPIEGVLC